MTTTRPIGESRTRVLAHEVRAVHATTKAPVAVTARFVDEPPRGWALRVAQGSVVVVTRDPRGPAPAAPVRVLLAAADGGRLSAPEAVVTLAGATATHEFAPAAMVLEVTLLKKTQAPRTGATVKVHPRTGADVTLTESPGGVYRSPARVWTSAFQPLDIKVGTTTVRRVPIDTSSRTMRVRLVDPT